MGFNQQSVNDNGGVAWVKQVAQTMDPGAIDSQIQGYQNAATSLAHVQTTLQNVKNNLAASWSGDAAEQAQQSFQASINHAQQTQDTILHAVIPPLQSAKSAQQTFMTSVNKVPNEQTVPSNSFVDDVGSFFGVESPAQTAEAHNTTVRAQAADALNTLSDSYESSATQLQSVGSSHEGVVTTSGTSSGAFNLGPVETSSGDGAASSYGEGITAGTYASRSEYTAPPSGTVNSGPDPKTTLSGMGDPGGGATITQPPPGQVGTTPPPNPSPLEPDPIWSTSGPVESDPGYGGGSGLITDEPDGGLGNGVGNGGLGDGDDEGGSGKLGGNGGVFDETGMGDGELTGGTGSGLRNGMSNTDSSGLGGDGDSVGGSGGMAEGGEGGESGMGGGMGRGMGGGFGSGDEELASSKYSRGRFIGVTEEDDNPSLSPVRSAFEDATDADGNKVDMMGSGRSGASGDDEEDERGKRPSYLKEDEFWKNAQRIVPPVIQ
jgi:uncharacterized protein YukE